MPPQLSVEFGCEARHKGFEQVRNTPNPTANIVFVSATVEWPAQTAQMSRVFMSVGPSFLRLVHQGFATLFEAREFGSNFSGRCGMGSSNSAQLPNPGNSSPFWVDSCRPCPPGVSFGSENRTFCWASWLRKPLHLEAFPRTFNCLIKNQRERGELSAECRLDLVQVSASGSQLMS